MIHRTSIRPATIAAPTRRGAWPAGEIDGGIRPARGAAAAKHRGSRDERSVRDRGGERRKQAPDDHGVPSGGPQRCGLRPAMLA